MLNMIVFAIFFASTTVLAQASTLKVAYSVYPPFVMAGGKAKAPKGVIVDYWEKEIAAPANLKIQWIGPLSYLRAKKMTLSGAADAIYLIPTSVADKQKVPYSKKVKFITKQGLVVLKSDPLAYLTNATELNDKSIGKFAGGHMPELLKNSPANIVEILADDPIVRGLKMLLEKRLWGFYVVSSEAALYALEKMNAADKVKIFEVPGEKSTVVCTLGFSPSIDPQLLQKIYAAAEKKDSNEVFQNIMKTSLGTERKPATVKNLM